MPANKSALVRVHRRRLPPDTPHDFERVGELRYKVAEFNREFDYTPLGLFLKPQLASAFAEAHVEYLIRFSRKTAINRFLALRRLAEFASDRQARRTGLKRFESIYSGAGADAWKKTVANYVIKLERRETTLTTFAEEIGNLFRGLDELTSRGLAAKCARPALPKNYHASGKRKPGLVEQSSKNPVEPALLAQLEAHIDSLNLPIKGEEARDLLGALAAQVPVSMLHSEVAVADAIFGINAKALEDARASAEAAFMYWRGVWLRGQELLNSPRTSVVTVGRSGRMLPARPSDALLRALFSPELGDEAVANFLKFFHEQFGLYIPANAETKWPHFMRRAFWQLGGHDYFNGCFSLHRRGVAAAVILYLVDSGANVSTALSLTTESEQATDDPNFVDFVSFKDRAGPEPIIKELPLKTLGVKVTAAQALHEVKQMTQALRVEFPDVLGDALFVFRSFQIPSVLTSGTLVRNFRYMLRARQMSEVWTPGAIRIAVAVEVSGKTEGDLDKVGRKLSHAVSSATTPIYALRLAARLLLTRKMSEYQTLLEAAFATHASRGPLVLGYSEEVADLRVDKAVRTGLGFLCRDASARGGKVDKDGTSCPVVGKCCASCQVRVFVTDAESLTEIIAVNKCLSMKLDAAGEGELDTWMENWLDLYAFSAAVIHKVKRSRFAYLIPAANRRAQELQNAGFDPILVRE
jgi:hypothetical protein